MKYLTNEAGDEAQWKVINIFGLEFVNKQIQKHQPQKSFLFIDVQTI